MQLEYLLGVISAFIFITGFFPITNNIGDFHNEPPVELNNVSLTKNIHYTSNIRKIVLVVIDALRLDFGSDMPFTSTISSNNGCFIQVSVETPTVTLPRIKALTTGNVPQFMDIVLNLANAAALKDSLIHSARKQQKIINFYGDDTWLKLFPTEFNRFEGTNSFFVNDFKEVDDNVTRNLNIELQKDDWDILILHYLGLDHIGHVHGPFSSLIPAKLKEMDNIIHKIYETLHSQNILLIVTADHGMRDSGGHGGSTYGETNVPLFLIGLNCQNGSIRQSDIPVNLAVLLGLDIPSTAIGKVEPNLFNFSLEKQLYILRYNLLLLKQKSNLCDKDFNLASQLHFNYIQNHSERDAFQAIDLYKQCSHIISLKLMRSSVNQNTHSLSIAVLIMVNVLVCFILNIFIPGLTSSKLSRFLLSVSVLQFLQPSLFILSIVISLLSLFINITVMASVRCKSINNKLLSILFVQPLMFISSSFVEEEHQVWYFANSVLILIQAIHYVKLKNTKFFIYCIFQSIYLRFIRRLNSTGDQWANYPDLSDWFLKSENDFYYISFFIFSLLFLYMSVVKLIKYDRNENYIIILVLFCIFLFKVTDSVLLGQISWLFILFHLVIFHKTNKVVTWILIGSLLLKPYNVVLVPFCIIFHSSITKIIDNTEFLVLCHIWLGNMLFFAQGHSNSLASVDVSVGYVGLYSYQPIVVIFQVLLHTYVFPVLCHSLVLRTYQKDEKKVWTIIFCNRFYTFFVVSIITYILRHHLFIWSVFAPKLFIEFVHIIFLFLEFCCYFIIKNINSCFWQNKFIKR